MTNDLHDYELILCKNDKTQISTINYIDINYSPRFRSYSQMTFRIPYYNNDVLRTKNGDYVLTKAAYLVLLNIKKNDEVFYSEYFAISEITNTSQNGVNTKDVSCFSKEYMLFNKKKLRTYKEVTLLYDPDNPTDRSKGIINYMLDKLYHTWSVGYMNVKYKNVHHIFDFSDNTFTDVFKKLETSYNCFIIFDNINNEINIYSPEEYGENMGVVLSDENFIKSIAVSDKIDQMVTRLYVYGKNNISINKYNITGQSYIENYNWFLNNGYFSNGLSTAMINYNNLISSKEGEYEGYVNSLDSLEANLISKSIELVNLQIELKVIQTSMDVEKNNNSNTTTYDNLYIQEQSKLTAISSKQAELTSIQSQIDSVNANILALQQSLSYDNNFTTDQLEELIEFIYEDTLNINEVDNESLLYEYAKQYIVKTAIPPIDFDTDSIDVFSCEEGKNIWQKLQIGSFVNIYCPELGYEYYPVRLVAYSHSKSSNSLTLYFSNTDRLNLDILYSIDLQVTANQTSIDVETNKDSYAQYSNDKEKIIYTDSTIDTSQTPINSGGVKLNQRGFIGTDIGTNGALQFLKDKIIISNDNWQTFHTILSGNGIYLEKRDKSARIIINPDYGFQIDKNVGTISSPSWSNVIYLDNSGNAYFSGNITGSTITSSVINVSTNVTIGNLLQLGSLSTSANKGILFLNSSGNITEIRMDTSGILHIMSIEGLSLYTHDKLDIIMEDISGSGADLTINHKSGSGNLLLYNQGYGNILFNKNPYIGSNSDDNKILTKSEILALLP